MSSGEFVLAVEKNSFFMRELLFTLIELRFKVADLLEKERRFLGLIIT
jgi:hypothetical protein